MNFIDDDIRDMIDDEQGFSTDISWDGSTHMIKGIFDAPFTGISSMTGNIETSSPAVNVKSSDVIGIKHGDYITVNSLRYKVNGLQPDGNGMTLIILIET